MVGGGGINIKAISVQFGLNLPVGTELGNIYLPMESSFQGNLSSKEIYIFQGDLSSRVASREGLDSREG